jgi:hypothetical protein
MAFKFNRSRPDPYYKLILLYTNQDVHDISRNGWGVKNTGKIYTDNDIAKFGNNSVQVNVVTPNTLIYLGPNDYYSPPTTNNTSNTYSRGLRNGYDFTIEGWYYITSGISANCLIYFWSLGYDGYSIFSFTYNNNPGYGNGIRRSWSSVGGVFNSQWLPNTEDTISLNTWNHLCWSRNGTSLYYFLNGSLIYTETSSEDLGFLLHGGIDITAPFIFCGGNRTTSGQSTTPPGGNLISARQIVGYVQCLKFSTVARYISDFYPTKPY